MKQLETKVVDLGFALARISRDNTKEGRADCLTIVEPSVADEGYSPAESISVYSRKAHIKLRDLINESLKEEEE